MTPIREVRDLGRENLGEHVDIQGWMRGYLYGIRDDFHDGYPDRTLTLVCEYDDCGYGHEQRFSDSDPSYYPKTMGTPVHSLETRHRASDLSQPSTA